MRLLIGLIVLLGLLLLVLMGRYGGGEPYPDLSGDPIFDESVLEVVVTSPEPIGNLAVSADGRVFYTIHPESRPKGAKLLEWVDGAPKAYPSEERQELLQTPLGVVIDRQNRLWTIDHGNHGIGTPRLLAFDLATGAIAHDHELDSSIAQLGSFLQDLQVDSTGKHIFIADVSFWRKNPGLIVYDIAARTARRVLQSDESVSPQNWMIRNPTKDMVFFGGLVVLKPGVDGIAIDRDDEWLYYGAMTHDTMFRVKVADLLDASLSEGALSARVEPVGEKPLNDGMSTDNEGNLLITDVEHGAVIRMSPDGKLTNLVESTRIRWADALSYGPDGWLYVADSAIPDQMLRSRAHIEEGGPVSHLPLQGGHRRGARPVVTQRPARTRRPGRAPVSLPFLAMASPLDECREVAVGVLHEPLSARGEVLEHRRGEELELIEVNDVDVGAEPGLQLASRSFKPMKRAVSARLHLDDALDAECGRSSRSRAQCVMRKVVKLASQIVPTCAPPSLKPGKGERMGEHRRAPRRGSCRCSCRPGSRAGLRRPVRASRRRSSRAPARRSPSPRRRSSPSARWLVVRLFAEAEESHRDHGRGSRGSSLRAAGACCRLRPPGRSSPGSSAREARGFASLPRARTSGSWLIFL